jgi:hypothetical protein
LKKSHTFSLFDLIKSTAGAGRTVTTKHAVYMNKGAWVEQELQKVPVVQA